MGVTPKKAVAVLDLVAARAEAGHEPRQVRLPDGELATIVAEVPIAFMQAMPDQLAAAATLGATPADAEKISSCGLSGLDLDRLLGLYAVTQGESEASAES